MLEDFLDWLADATGWLEDKLSFLGDTMGFLDDLAESSPVLSSIWFWLFYAALMFGVWVGPEMFGVTDYKLWEKFAYTAIFFVLDYVIVNKLTND